MPPSPLSLLSEPVFTAAMKAYYEAFQCLPQFPSDRLCDELATRIMTLAESGERDPLKLRDHALRGMASSIASAEATVQSRDRRAKA